MKNIFRVIIVAILMVITCSIYAADETGTAASVF